MVKQGREGVHAKSLQLCLTLWDPMDCSSPGSSVHGILQARTLEWVAMPSSRRSSQPRDRVCISYIACIGRQVLVPPGKPKGWGVAVNTDETSISPLTSYCAAGFLTGHGPVPVHGQGVGDPSYKGKYWECRACTSLQSP